MDKKSIAAAKRASIRRDRGRYLSRVRRSQRAPAPGSSGLQSESLWDGFDEVLPLEEVEIDGERARSKGLDYGELLAQDPFYSFSALPPRSGEVLDDAIAGIFSFDDSEDSNLAEFLALDLDKLSERLASVSLAKRLFLEEDETLPSELFVGDEAQVEVDDEEEPQVSGSSTEESREWLNLVVNDPEDGEPVKLSDGGAEESEKRGGQEDLDSLLEMLDKVTIEVSKDTSSGSEVMMMNIDVAAGSELERERIQAEHSEPLMPREELEMLFWSPGSSKPEASEVKKPVEASPTEDDFDAWLDSLDD